MPKPTVYLATDHRGFELKEFLKERLTDAEYQVIDFGAATYDPTDDFPDFVEKAAKAVHETPGSMAIILGHSGQGEAMDANRFKGVRAAVYYGGPQDIVTLSRQHNDANVLSLGAGFLSLDEAWSAVERWLITPFSGDERHIRRIKKLDD